MKSSAPASIEWIFSWSPLAVTMTTGRKAVAGSLRIRRQTSYAVEVRHHHVEEHQVRLGGRELEPGPRCRSSR